VYKTVSETAKDISMPEEMVLRYIYEGRIKAVHDGEQFLINSAQFETYHEQLKQIKEEIELWRNTPIPEDIDVKDED
jgi:excisionase family DNA binding protein